MKCFHHGVCGELSQCGTLIVKSGWRPSAEWMQQQAAPRLEVLGGCHSKKKQWLSSLYRNFLLQKRPEASRLLLLEFRDSLQRHRNSLACFACCLSCDRCIRSR